jgi:hypothetical protein
MKKKTFGRRIFFRGLRTVMMKRRDDNRAMRRTLIGVLVALVFSPLALFAQSPVPNQIDFTDVPPLFPDKQAAPKNDIIVEDLPAPKLELSARLMFEPGAAVRPPPLFEYRPVSEMQASHSDATYVPFTRAGAPPLGSRLGRGHGGKYPGIVPHRYTEVWLWERWDSPADCMADIDAYWQEGFGTCKRFCGGLHECLCCPDPCYQPHWIPIADAAFDVPAVRPVTQQRLRWDRGLNVVLPDRAEYFWARADGNGRGPAPAPGLLLASDRVSYHDVWYQFEAAIERFSVMVQVPYRSLEPSQTAHAVGFGDLKVGAKTLIFDCELLQIGAQVMVTMPTGNANRGLGTGHYAVEPSLLLGLRVGPETYLQAQLAEWIPVRGDSQYAGRVFQTHVALNRTLLRLHENWPLIGTVGFNSWTFQDGEYTDPVLGSNQRAGGFTYMSAGPGLRLFICDHIDIGFGANFSLNRPNFAEVIYTSEFRWRF